MYVLLRGLVNDSALKLYYQSLIITTCELLTGLRSLSGRSMNGYKND